MKVIIPPELYSSKIQQPNDITLKDKKSKIAPDDDDEEKGDDSPSKPVRLKENEKKDPKFKDYEKGGAGGDAGKGGGKEAKFKDYEKGKGGPGEKGGAGPPPSTPDPLESGAKQRKSNKRYKDYEEKDGGPGSNDKKDA